MFDFLKFLIDNTILKLYNSIVRREPRRKNRGHGDRTPAKEKYRARTRGGKPDRMVTSPNERRRLTCSD